MELFGRTSCPKLTRGAFAVIVSWVACLRISELAELHWKDISTSEGVMEVNRGVRAKSIRLYRCGFVRQKTTKKPKVVPPSSKSPQEARSWPSWRRGGHYVRTRTQRSRSSRTLTTEGSYRSTRYAKRSNRHFKRPVTNRRV